MLRRLHSSTLRIFGKPQRTTPPCLSVWIELNCPAATNRKFGICGRRIIGPITTGTCDDLTDKVTHIIDDGPHKNHYFTLHESRTCLLMWKLFIHIFEVLHQTSTSSSDHISE
ncbi:hypothetical protein AVEN_178766-1 [Araneus ventricosus]|uniref:Uncharacterized protein n=1 Tax=Araneus ventricosus TaxID=182803 RepID=A0A4Y2H7X1_ARAVE|nr:hypothetical protein AVEN_178766-1 [Araneus ventricosus]